MTCSSLTAGYCFNNVNMGKLPLAWDNLYEYKASCTKHIDMTEMVFDTKQMDQQAFPREYHSGPSVS